MQGVDRLLLCERERVARMNRRTSEGVQQFANRRTWVRQCQRLPSDRDQGVPVFVALLPV